MPHAPFDLTAVLKEFLAQCDLPLPLVSVAIGANEFIIVSRLFDDGTGTQSKFLCQREAGPGLALPITVTLIARDGRSTTVVIEPGGLRLLN